MESAARILAGILHGTHPWARELLGPFVIGALDLEEESAVEQHVAGCADCQEEERALRETHERLVGAFTAATSAPPHLMRTSSPRCPLATEAKRR